MPGDSSVSGMILLLLTVAFAIGCTAKTEPDPKEKSPVIKTSPPPPKPSELGL